MYGGGMATTSVAASGTSVSTPVYRFSRAIAFEARLSDPQTSRKFWVGGGQTNSGGGGLIGAISTSNGAQVLPRSLAAGAGDESYVRLRNRRVPASRAL